MEDFKRKEIVEMIQVVLMVQLGKPPLTSFKSLSGGGQKKFNQALNAYIRELPEEWDAKLQEDFNTACNDELYTNKFKAEAQFVGILNDDIIRLRREGEEHIIH